jgi:hypothetical protein
MTTSQHPPRSSHQACANGQTLPTYPAYSDVRFAMPCHSRARVLLKTWGSNLLRAWITPDQAELWQSVSYQIHLQDLQGKEPSVAFSLLYILYHTVSIPIDVIFRHIKPVILFRKSSCVLTSFLAVPKSLELQHLNLKIWTIINGCKWM